MNSKSNSTPPQHWQKLKATAFIVCGLSALLPGISNASFVTMETTFGNINIELFDTVAPLTTQNFLNYVQDGDYTNNIIHRSAPGFVIQGGSFRYDSNIDTFSDVPTDAPVVNEFSISNTRGTIAMAKLGGNPDSATSGWFFNLADNSANLDFQNGGFTVFGQVIGNGMEIVDSIAALPTFNQSATNPAFTNLPLSGFTGSFDPANQLALINNVSVSSVPLPSSIWLFGTGLLGLIKLSRKKCRV